MCGSRKDQYLPHGRFFHLNSLIPLEIPVYLDTFPYKFWLLRPLDDLPRGRYGYFLEPQNLARHCMNTNVVTDQAD